MSAANDKGEFGAAEEERKRELRKIRRLKGENYRNRYLLPRYVLEEDGTKRKLEPGEYDPNSQLYPISTPIREMSDFGKQQQDAQPREAMRWVTTHSQAHVLPRTVPPPSSLLPRVALVAPCLSPLVFGSVERLTLRALFALV